MTPEIENRIQLAIVAMKRDPKLSIRDTASIYSVNRMTLARRLRGRVSKIESIPASRKLSNIEENAIIEHIKSLDSKGYPPRRSHVQNMANLLVAKSNKPAVGGSWTSNFIRRHPELRSRYARKYDYKRAKAEDPVQIQAWFDRVKAQIIEHGIPEDDIYNFDETGFAMGIIATKTMVVTAIDRTDLPKLIQPGNREWVTVIQGINSKGWSIPPFFIVKGKKHLSGWFRENIPGNWMIATSTNGWTSNTLGLEWLQHFHTHTKDRCMGKKRLLTLDGHESHQSAEFIEFCKQNDIIPVCMPPHTSHLLQPLDVGCFGPLKKAYNKEIETLTRNQITHITKTEFLPAFRVAFDEAMTSSNIQGAFRGSGLCPYNPDRVLSNLAIRPHTPSLPAPIAD
jgi:hypothetical protein